VIASIILSSMIDGVHQDSLLIVGGYIQMIRQDVEVLLQFLKERVL
jgi:hypothetical protein